MKIALAVLWHTDKALRFSENSVTINLNLPLFLSDL